MQIARVRVVAALCGAAAATLLGSATAQEGRNVEWPVYGGSLAAQHYSPLDQIDASNVKDLKIVWRWYGGNFGPNPEMKSETTPIMIDGVLYATAGATRNVVAIDAATGETLRIFKPNDGDRFRTAPRRTSARCDSGSSTRTPGSAAKSPPATMTRRSCRATARGSTRRPTPLASTRTRATSSSATRGCS